MCFEVIFRKAELSMSLEKIKQAYEDSVTFKVDGYALKTTTYNTILLTFENENDGEVGVVEVDNTPHNVTAIMRLIKEALWQHGENGKLVITTYYSKDGHVEDHMEFSNWFSKYHFTANCVSTKPAEAIEELKKEYEKEVEETLIQLDVHTYVQDRFIGGNTYFLKYPTDIWTRLDTDESLGILTVKPHKVNKGDKDTRIVLGPIHPASRYTNALGDEISRKLATFLTAVRKIDMEHERAKLIAHEVYSSKSAYETNELSCLRLELYVEDIESSVGKIEKAEIFI